MPSRFLRKVSVNALRVTFVAPVTRDDLYTQLVDRAVDDRWMRGGRTVTHPARPQSAAGSPPVHTQSVHRSLTRLNCENRAYPHYPLPLIRRLSLTVIDDKNPASEGWGQALEVQS